jgi:hypothetical protein
MKYRDYDDGDDNQPVWPTWAVGVIPFTVCSICDKTYCALFRGCIKENKTHKESCSQF